MEPIQRKIMDHLRKQFAPDAPVEIFPEGRRCVVVTDGTGDKMTVTVNGNGDLMDADTGKVYGVSCGSGWIEVR